MIFGLQKAAVMKFGKLAVILAVIAGIGFGFYFYYKDVEKQRAERDATIRELTLTKKSLEETNKTLERRLLDEAKKEKVITVYRDRVIKSEKKNETRKSEVVKQSLKTTEEINKTFKGVMACFEQQC